MLGGWQEKLQGVERLDFLQEKLEEMEFQMQQLQKRASRPLPKKFKVSVSLDQKQYRRLEALSKKHGIAKSALLRAPLEPAVNALTKAPALTR